MLASERCQERGGELVLSYTSHFVGLGFLLCELLCEIRKVKGLLAKRLRKEIQVERLTLFTAISLFHLLKKKPQPEKNPNNQTLPLVLARMNCSRQLHLILLFLSTGVLVLLRPLIRTAPLPDSHGDYGELEIEG